MNGVVQKGIVFCCIQETANWKEVHIIKEKTRNGFIFGDYMHQKRITACVNRSRYMIKLFLKQFLFMCLYPAVSSFKNTLTAQ